PATPCASTAANNPWTCSPAPSWQGWTTVPRTTLQELPRIEAEGVKPSRMPSGQERHSSTRIISQHHGPTKPHRNRPTGTPAAGACDDPRLEVDYEPRPRTRGAGARRDHAQGRPVVGRHRDHGRLPAHPRLRYRPA